MSRRGGFTLIELLIVIAVIAVLAAILIPNLVSAVGATRLTQTTQLIEQVSGAIQMYADDYHPRGHYPPDEGQEPYRTIHVVEQLREHDIYNFSDHDLQETPEEEWEMIDGWGEPLRYQEWRSKPNPPESARNPTRFDLYSAGEDGDFETEVLGNWAAIDEAD